MSSPMHLTTASTVTLTLYSDWHFCSGCGFPRAKDGKTAGKCAERETVNDVATKQEGAEQRRVCQKKLSICRRCKTAAYHDSECQRIHWKRGHRYDCNKLAKAIQPLKDIIASFEHHRDVTRGNRRPQRYWWDLLDPRDAAYSNRLWKESAVRWNRYGEYLEAMEGFQTALAQTGKMWNDHSVTIANNAHDTSHLEKTQDDKRSLSSSPVQDGDDGADDDNSSISSGIRLARKLLFCAYCEADGNQIQSARSRLAQCVSILLEGCCSSSLLSPSDPNNRELQKRQQLQKTINPLLDDAWMELMLSYEEEKSPEVRRIARHVAHMAIQSSRGPGSLYRCEWKDPLQRPGYMAVLGTICDRNGTKLHPFQSSVMMQPYIPPEAHPSWCETLESNWETIAKELSELVAAGKASSKQRWAAVGSGDRGSGGDDHRVVSAGGKWTEYVLFGTGAIGSGSSEDRDEDAPSTKRLLRSCIPDAISLAESGGGEVIFSKLAPRTRIEAHCGPTNFRLTAHLGLVIPDEEAGECKIRVKNEWHRWETGKVMLFDDSYEHEIRNDTDQVRIVLLLRLWHPLLSPDRRQKELMEARRRKELAVSKRYHPSEH